MAEPVWDVDSGGPKEPYIRRGAQIPTRGKGRFGGMFRNIWHEPKLFGRWQQQCALSLSALQ